MAADFTVSPSDYVEVAPQIIEAIGTMFSMSPSTYTELIDTSGGGGSGRPITGMLYPRGQG